MGENSINSDRDYPPGVEFIKDIYLGLLFLFPAFAIAGFIIKNIKIAGSALVSFIICLLVFHGISKKKEWTVAAVLLTSAWGILNTFFRLIEPSTGFTALVFKVSLGPLFFIFYIYSLIIFSKNQTRKFFRAEGKILF